MASQEFIDKLVHGITAHEEWGFTREDIRVFKEGCRPEDEEGRKLVQETNMRYFQKDSDIMANVLVSFLCAMQMETFRTFLDGEAIATTVSTGNLRKMVEKLYEAATKRSRAAAVSASCYFLVIAVFVSGAFLGTWLSGPLSVRAVLFPAGLLLAAFAVITANRRRRTAASGV